MSENKDNNQEKEADKDVNKNIPDIILEADTNREKFSNTSKYNKSEDDVATRKKWAEEFGVSEHCKLIFSTLETGDRIWAYSYCKKVWFYSIVIKLRPEGCSIGAYSEQYKAWGETHPIGDGVFYTNKYSLIKPDDENDCCVGGEIRPKIVGL